MYGFIAAGTLTLMCAGTGRDELAIVGLFVIALMWFIDEKFSGAKV